MSQFDNTSLPSPKSLEKIPIKLSEVDRIAESRCRMVLERIELKKLVETPLLEACEILYDKNIRTTETSANAENIKYSRKVGIVIDFDTLSTENKEIARKLCQIGNNHPDGYTAASIEIPVSESTTVAEIKKEVEAIVKQFKLQPLIWSPGMTIQEMRQLYTIDPGDENYPPESFLDPESKLYYDEETRLFYVSKEHFKKTKAYIAQ